MTDFDSEGVVRKPLDKRGEIRNVFGSAVERKRELQQHGAEAMRFAKNVETGTSFALF